MRYRSAVITLLLSLEDDAMVPVLFVWAAFAVATVVAANARRRSADGGFLLRRMFEVFALLAVPVMTPVGQKPRG